MDKCKDHCDTVLQLCCALGEQKDLLTAREIRCAQLESEKKDLEECTDRLQHRVQHLKHTAESAQLETKQVRRRARVVERRQKSQAETTDTLRMQLQELRNLHREVYGALLDGDVDSSHGKPNRIFGAIRTYCSRFMGDTSTRNRREDVGSVPTDLFPPHTNDHTAGTDGTFAPSHQENGGHLFESHTVEGCRPSRICSFFKRKGRFRRLHRSLFRWVASPVDSEVPAVSSASRESGQRHNPLDCLGCFGTHTVRPAEARGNDGAKHQGKHKLARIIPGRTRADTREVKAECAELRNINISHALERDNNGLTNAILRKQTEIDDLENHLLEVIEYSEMLEKSILHLRSREEEGCRVGGSILGSDTNSAALEPRILQQFSGSTAYLRTDSATETTAEPSAEDIGECSTEYFTDGVVTKVVTEGSVELIAQCSTEYLTYGTESDCMTEPAALAGGRKEHDDEVEN